MSTMGVVLVGIAIVFICMIIITVILSVFPFISGSEIKKKDKQEALEIKAAGPVPAENVVQTSANAESENETLIAVITAAVAAYLGAVSYTHLSVQALQVLFCCFRTCRPQGIVV